MSVEPKPLEEQAGVIRGEGSGIVHTDPGNSRELTEGEISLAKFVFGDTIDYRRVRIFRKKYFLFQPRARTMAPDGNIYFHPRSPAYRDDFSNADTRLQGLFIHEMTHVWQHQAGTDVRKAMFNRRYRYELKRGKSFSSYGLEQQCEIVRDYFLACRQSGADRALDTYEEILPFPDVTNI